MIGGFKKLKAMAKQKFAKIKSLDDAEVKKLFLHVLKESLNCDPNPEDKCDLENIKELIEVADLEVELILHYNPAPKEEKGAKKVEEDEEF